MPLAFASPAPLALRPALPLFSHPCKTCPRASASPQPPRPNPLSAAWDFLSSIRRPGGLPSSVEDFETTRESLFEDDLPPEVLVVGATGQTGRVIVRKLLLRGYNVRVLVRDLYSATLDMLGTGVKYVRGSLDDYDSLLEATGDVDKVICTVGARKPEDVELVEYEGVSRLIRAFQDSRVQFYGRAEATKLVLFNFGDEEHLKKWKRVVPEVGEEGSRAPRVNFQITGPNRVAFMGHIYSTYSGVAEIRTVPGRVGLRGFSGILLRCVGDGKEYFLVLRTTAGMKEGVQYIAKVKSFKNKWASIRLPFSGFQAYSIDEHKLRRDAPELDRSDIRQMAIQYRKPARSPERDDGRFYLGVDYLKAYRTQEQPEFVLVSCGKVTSGDFSSVDEKGIRGVENGVAFKYLAEKRLRESGLTYCIVRPGRFTDQPGGNKAIVLEQDGDVEGAISRADLAEICVRSLLDPRACNVTFDAFESMYAPSARLPGQDVSTMLGNLRPNT